MVLQNNTYELYRAFSIQIVIHVGLIYIYVIIRIVCSMCVYFCLCIVLMYMSAFRCVSVCMHACV